MRRSTVLSLSPLLVFPDLIWTLDLMIISRLFYHCASCINCSAYREEKGTNIKKVLWDMPKDS